jgi:hypothetical protein
LSRRPIPIGRANSRSWLAVPAEQRDFATAREGAGQKPLSRRERTFVRIDSTGSRNGCVAWHDEAGNVVVDPVCRPRRSPGCGRPSAMETDIWLEQNCLRCRKYNPDGPSHCEIEMALLTASFEDDSGLPADRRPYGVHRDRRPAALDLGLSARQARPAVGCQWWIAIAEGLNPWRVAPPCAAARQSRFRRVLG